MNAYRTVVFPTILSMTLLPGLTGCRTNNAMNDYEADRRANNLVPTPGNKEMQANVAAALARRAEVDTRGVKIEANNGYIVLTGHVRSDADRQAVKEIAQMQVGVRGVIVTNLRVGEEKPPAR